jgi:hypothetical protein
MPTVPILGLLLLFASVATSATGVDAMPQAPVTRRLVVLRVQDAAGRTTVVSVAIGKAATITRPGTATLRICPTSSPDGLLTLTTSVASTNDRDVSDYVLALPIALGGVARLEVGDYALNVGWIDDRTVESPLGADPEVAECCVVCEGIKTCACRVQAPCGGCCDEQCGGCGQTDSQTPGAGCVGSARPIQDLPPAGRTLAAKRTSTHRGDQDLPIHMSR